MPKSRAKGTSSVQVQTFYNFFCCPQ